MAICLLESRGADANNKDIINHHNKRRGPLFCSFFTLACCLSSPRARGDDF